MFWTFDAEGLIAGAGIGVWPGTRRPWCVVPVLMGPVAGGGADGGEYCETTSPAGFEDGSGTLGLLGSVGAYSGGSLIWCTGLEVSHLSVQFRSYAHQTDSRKGWLHLGLQEDEGLEFLGVVVHFVRINTFFRIQTSNWFSSS